MFVPLFDDHPIHHIRHPVVRDALIALNVLVFLGMEAGILFGSDQGAAVALGFIPSVFFGEARLPPELDAVPSTLTLLTSMFLHAGWMHLLGNMLFLWVFADNVEDDIGHFGFLAFYLVCGAAAAAIYGISNSHSQAPLIGASGAVSGVVAGYVMLHPRVKLWVLVLGRIPLKITAAWVIGAWLLYQLGSALILPDDAIAWWAHVGGFATGALLIGVFKRPHIPFFGRGLGPVA